VARLLQVSLKAGGEAVAPFLPELITGVPNGLIVRSFAGGANPFLLDLSSDIFTLFGGATPTEPALLLQLLTQLTTVVLQRFQAAPREHAAMMAQRSHLN
jgi:hypothetical protein